MDHQPYAAGCFLAQSPIVTGDGKGTAAPAVGCCRPFAPGACYQPSDCIRDDHCLRGRLDEQAACSRSRPGREALIPASVDVDAN